MAEQAPSLVVVGASAGGVRALKELAAGLPADLDAAVGVVLHLSARGDSRLPQILDRAGPLAATQAVHGEAILPGRIYVAPPDRHLLVRGGTWEVASGQRENNARPAIDPLFRSAAVAGGRRVVAVVLSGVLFDGAAGASAVSSVGGTVVVQDPQEAVFPDMPNAAIALDHPDHVLPVHEIAPFVATCVTRLSREEPVSDNGRATMTLEMRAAGKQTLEDALWAALRALLERAELARRTAARLRERGSSGQVVRRFDARAGEAMEQAEMIRRVLLERGDDDGA